MELNILNGVLEFLNGTTTVCVQQGAFRTEEKQEHFPDVEEHWQYQWGVKWCRRRSEGAKYVKL